MRPAMFADEDAVVVPRSVPTMTWFQVRFDYRPSSGTEEFVVTETGEDFPADWDWDLVRDDTVAPLNQPFTEAAAACEIMTKAHVDNGGDVFTRPFQNFRIVEVDQDGQEVEQRWVVRMDNLDPDQPGPHYLTHSRNPRVQEGVQALFVDHPGHITKGTLAYFQTWAEAQKELDLCRKSWPDNTYTIQPLTAVDAEHHKLFSKFEGGKE